MIDDLSCTDGWLMSERYTHASKDPICVQKDAIAVGSTSDDNGGVLNFIEMRQLGDAGDPLAIYPAYAELKVWLRLTISASLPTTHQSLFI
jgi:hypothetical protein